MNEIFYILFFIFRLKFQVYFISIEVSIFVWTHFKFSVATYVASGYCVGWHSFGLSNLPAFYYAENYFKEKKIP